MPDFSQLAAQGFGQVAQTDLTGAHESGVKLAQAHQDHLLKADQVKQAREDLEMKKSQWVNQQVSQCAMIEDKKARALCFQRAEKQSVHAGVIWDPASTAIMSSDEGSERLRRGQAAAANLPWNEQTRALQHFANSLSTPAQTEAAMRMGAELHQKQQQIAAQDRFAQQQAQAKASEVKEPKPEEFKKAQFGQQMQKAESDLNKLMAEGGYDPSSLGSGVQTAKMPVLGVGVPNRWKSEQKQLLDNAQNNFVGAILRDQSGAAIGNEEFEREKQRYFPQPGDSQAVMKQKEEARAIAINGFKQAAGSAWGRSGGDVGQHAASKKVGPTFGPVVQAQGGVSAGANAANSTEAALKKQRYDLYKAQQSVVKK